MSWSSPHVPIFFFFCWKCSGNQHEAYTCHELMCNSCQGLHLGSINRGEETFQGSVLIFNSLPANSLSLRNLPLAKPPRTFGILLFSIFFGLGGRLEKGTLIDIDLQGQVSWTFLKNQGRTKLNLVLESVPWQKLYKTEIRTKSHWCQMSSFCPAQPEQNLGV